MATSKKAEEDKKVMDVNAPGKAAPDASSRPVIVSHKPMMEDPMMAKRSSTTTPSAPPLNSRGKTIQPLGARSQQPSKSTAKPKADEPSNQAAEAEPSVDEAKAEPTTVENKEVELEATDTKTAEPAKTAEPTIPAKEPEEKKPATDEPATNDPEAEPVDKQEEKKKQQEAEEAAERAAAEKYEKLIADKTYFVPVDHNVSSSAGGKVFMVILFVVLLSLLAGVLAIDAGFVETDFQLPFDLIQNQ